MIKIIPLIDDIVIREDVGDNETLLIHALFSMKVYFSQMLI